MLRGEEPATRRRSAIFLEASFPGTGEALLVDRLRSDGDIVLSLVAEDGGVVIGYVAFSRLFVEGDETPFAASRSRRSPSTRNTSSRGSRRSSIREAHACLAALGETLSVVLGEPGYYGRFGYSNRRAARFESEYQSPYPDGAFLRPCAERRPPCLSRRLQRSFRRCRASS